MSEVDDQIKLIRQQLDALQQVKTQEEFDEGARLHALKNAPHISGPYSHLSHDVLHPVYTYKAFPKMLYDAEYEAACLEYDQAWMIPSRGTEDAERATALVLAERKKQQHRRIVQSSAEVESLRGIWFETPGEAVAAKKAMEQEIAKVAAHRAYEDRNMGEQAKRDLDAFDEAAEEHVAVMPEKKKPGPRTKVSIEN